MLDLLSSLGVIYSVKAFPLIICHRSGSWYETLDLEAAVQGPSRSYHALNSQSS